MSKIRFGIIGGGWRSEFFIRIAKQLPEVFEVSSVFLRNPEKAADYNAKFNVKTTSSFEEIVADKPDYVIVSTPRNASLEYSEKLFKAGIPVLSETPPAETLEELVELWDLIKKYDGKMQVAEQYFAQPLYATWLKAVENGIIGETNYASISAIHGYHFTNIARRFLNIQKENCVMYSANHSFPVTITGGHGGKVYSGEVTKETRNKVTLEFENEKVAFYDFSSIQYASSIRTRHLTIQGVRGEIDDTTIRYLNSSNDCIEQQLRREDVGVYNNIGWYHYGISLGNEFLYKNPFPNAMLNDDEIAIAYCMKEMKTFIDTGKSFYPMEEALQDSYLSILMGEAMSNPHKIIKSETQVWYK